MGRKSAVLLGLLSLVQGRQEPRPELALHEQHEVVDPHKEQRDALMEMPADELKSMLLNLLQEEEKEGQKGKKAPRPRKPDMRSPLEV